MCRVESSPASVINGPFLGELNNEHAEQFFSVADKWPFQDHLASKTIIAIQSSVLGRLSNEWPFKEHLSEVISSKALCQEKPKQ